MSAEVPNHTMADAFVRLAELVATGRVAAVKGTWIIEGTDCQYACEDIAAAMVVTTVEDWTGGITHRRHRTVVGSLMTVRTRLKYTTDDHDRRRAEATELVAEALAERQPMPGHADCTPFADQPVKCDRCGSEYVCAPSSDFYCAAEGDHCCEPCLLAGAGLADLVVMDDPEVTA